MRKEFAKTHGDFKGLVDIAYPPSNFECQKKGTKMNYNAQNKQMLGIEYNRMSGKIIITSVKNIKLLLWKVLGIKSFMLRIPKDEASRASMMKYKQIYMTHLAMGKCISSTELAGIMGLDTVTSVRVLDKNGNFGTIQMLLRSILMEITIPSSGKPLFLVSDRGRRF